MIHGVKQSPGGRPNGRPINGPPMTISVIGHGTNTGTDEGPFQGFTTRKGQKGHPNNQQSS
jgi:hypothetical protein